MIHENHLNSKPLSTNIHVCETRINDMNLFALQKSHHGPIVIGEKSAVHQTAGSNVQEINQELEHQFAESLEHKLSGGARTHQGLGFHNTEQEATGQTGDIHPQDVGEVSVTGHASAECGEVNNFVRLCSKSLDVCQF